MEKHGQNIMFLKWWGYRWGYSVKVYVFALLRGC